MTNLCRGFTLVEMLVSIAILAILLAIAVPSFRDLYAQNRLAAQTNELLASLSLARSEAVKRGSTVTVCKSSTGSACGAANWEAGWVVFVDTNNNGALDAGEAVLQVHETLPPGMTLRSNINFSNYITYRGDGTSNVSGQFVVCANNDLTHSAAVFVNATGRARAGADGNHDGIPEDESGNDITTCTP